MEYKWLKKTNSSKNKKIIIFFNGWGMDEGIIEHLEMSDFDIVMFYDYNFLETDFDFNIIKNYQESYLVAWSMGVMTATFFNVNYTKKIAINGTLKPIDDLYGIPNKIYKLTMKSFSEKGAERFMKNMFKDFADIPIIKREFENQKSELKALAGYKANLDFKYDKIIISSEDKIIPTKNQEAFWGINANIDSGHAPFILFKKWSEIL